MKYYAVRKGRVTGIFTSWDETSKQVNGFSGAEYKSFNTVKEAEDYLNGSPFKEQNIQNNQTKIKIPPKVTIIKEEKEKETTLTNKIINGVWNSVKESVVGSDISEENRKKRTIYTDGSCVEKIGGYGFLVVRDDGYTEPFCGKVPAYPCTNQVAELYAILKAVTHFSDMYPYSSGLDLYTDSKYSIGCLTEWWPNWNKNGWRNAKGEVVANKGLIQDILKVLTLLKNRGCVVNFYHVFGHSGDKYNEMCDALANQGRGV